MRNATAAHGADRVSGTDRSGSLSRTTTLATVAVLANLLFLAAVAVLPLLRPDVDAIDRGISEYAVGPYGIVQGAAFVVLGFGSLALALALSPAVVASVSTATAATLVALSGVCQVVLGVFPMDVRAPITLSGRIHGTIGPIASVTLLGATLLLALAFRDDLRWRAWVRPSLVLFAGASAAAFATQLAQDEPGLGWPFGLLMRLYVVPLVAWWLAVALRLRRLSRGRPVVGGSHSDCRVV